jgi:hypothetical protein
VKAQPLPTKVRDAVETLIRAATDEKYIIIGCLFKENSIALLRNTSDNPSELFRGVASLIDKKEEDGLIVEERITPVN